LQTTVAICTEACTNLLLTRLQAGISFFCHELHFSRGKILFSLSTSWPPPLHGVFTTATTSTLEQNIFVILFVPICELGNGGTTLATIHA
jgi:hypothetical protein